MSKKGDLSINYAFLIFVSVIAVFVIIGMISGWAFNAKNMMCKLTGECKEGETLIDKQTITVDSTDGNNARFVNEIIKHSKLCFTRSSEGSNRGELCYTVKCNAPTPFTCTARCNDIQPGIEASIGAGKVDCTDFDSSNKAIIEFDYGRQVILIR
ncbi:MAG: hypothetical protein V1859_09300 [archaeon]